MRYKSGAFLEQTRAYVTRVMASMAPLEKGMQGARAAMLCMSSMVCVLLGGGETKQWVVTHTVFEGLRARDRPSSFIYLMVTWCR